MSNKTTFIIYEFLISFNNFIDLLIGVTVLDSNHMVSKRFPEILDLYYNIYKLNCNYTYNYAGTITQYANYSNKYNKDKFYLIKQVNSLADIFYNEFEKQYANVTLSNLEF